MLINNSGLKVVGVDFSSAMYKKFIKKIRM